MSVHEPPEAVTREAVAMLLHLAFIEIRSQTSPAIGDRSPEALAKRCDRI
ncbi:hypothetical protein O7630_22955 [Micromonospora sp. WMMD718]|nr:MULTISPECIES: hypothetical protein [unclassified Micromonospora]MDG4753801.1 hypothetical protein [Micromonospora sp. WMMD718]